MAEPTTRETEHQALKALYARYEEISSFLYMNRRSLGQFCLLSLRIAQLLGAVVIGSVYSAFIEMHRHHECAYRPYQAICQIHRSTPLDHVPEVYVLVLFTAIVAFFQLHLTVATIFLSHDLNLKSSSSSGDSAQKTQMKGYPKLYLRRNILLWVTDIPVLALYVISFIWLSGYTIPTRVLLGALDGTSCYYSNRYDKSMPIVLQSCVLAQWGYWFTMGTMISYFITVFLFWKHWIEDNTLRRVAKAIEAGDLSTRASTEGGTVEEVLIMLD